MADPYPYAMWTGHNSFVYFPTTKHSFLLSQDATHMLKARFHHLAQNPDPSIIQIELVRIYGGQIAEYQVQRLSHGTYLIALPEFLDRRDVIDELLIWAVEHGVYLSGWVPHYNHGWRQGPISYRVYFRVHNFPTDFWHYYYFWLFTSGFGDLLYVDDENIRGPDRSSLRMTVRCFDLALIPPVMIVHNELEWTRCWISIIGWEMDGPPSNISYNGPVSGGSLVAIDGAHEPVTHTQNMDSEVRRSLIRAHNTLGNMASEAAANPPADLGWQWAFPIWSTGETNTPCPPNIQSLGITKKLQSAGLGNSEKANLNPPKKAKTLWLTVCKSHTTFIIHPKSQPYPKTPKPHKNMHMLRPHIISQQMKKSHVPNFFRSDHLTSKQISVPLPCRISLSTSTGLQPQLITARKEKPSTLTPPRIKRQPQAQNQGPSAQKTTLKRQNKGA